MLSLTACAPKKKSQIHEPTPQQVSWCEAEKNKYEDRTRRLYVENTKHVLIERHFQRVLRYNCQNNLISNKIETIKSPHKMVTLKPTYPKFKNMGYVEILNIDTCYKNSAYLEKDSRILFRNLVPMTGKTNGEIKLNGDIAPALFTYRLRKGQNRIYYTYYEEGSERQFSGIYNVFVEYVSKTLPDEKHVRQENCSSIQQ